MTRAAFVRLAVLIAMSSPLFAQAGAPKPQGGGRGTKPPITATATQIATLPGIGLKTAELVVQYRTKNGPFKKIEEIMNVRGIGEKSFLKIKDRLSVAAPQK